MVDMLNDTPVSVCYITELKVEDVLPLFFWRKWASSKKLVLFQQH